MGHLSVYAKEIDASVSAISRAISSLDAEDQALRPRKAYKQPELTEEDKAFLDSLREKR